MAIDLPTVSGRLETASVATSPGAVWQQSCRFSSAAPSVRSPVPAKRLDDHAHALVGQLGDERPEVARLHADVRVGDDVDLARRRPLEADELRDLGVDGGVRVGQRPPARRAAGAARRSAARRGTRGRRLRPRRRGSRTTGSRCGRTTRGSPRGRRRDPARGLKMRDARARGRPSGAAARGAPDMPRAKSSIIVE